VGSLAAAGCRQAMNRSGWHQDRAVAGDLPVAQLGAARVVAVAVEVADPHRVERDIRLGGELPGSFTPAWPSSPAIRNRPGATRSLTGRRRPSSRSIQAYGSGGTRAGGRLIHADVVGRRGRRAAVGHDGRRLVAVAVLDVELAELHRLRAHRPQHARAVPGVLGPAGPHPVQLRLSCWGRRSRSRSATIRGARSLTSSRASRSPPLTTPSWPVRPTAEPRSSTCSSRSCPRW
jgi:hypothetical protein